jgi:hypothetical protein
MMKKLKMGIGNFSRLYRNSYAVVVGGGVARQPHPPSCDITRYDDRRRQQTCPPSLIFLSTLAAEEMFLVTRR